MANNVKENGKDAMALQITKPARKADLVDESEGPDGKNRTERMANLRVYAFEHFLLAFDIDRVDESNIAELVRKASEYTDSIYRATEAQVQKSGHGYQISVTIGADAGWKVGMPIGTYPAPGMLGMGLGERVDSSNDDPEAKEHTSVPPHIVSETVKIGRNLADMRKTQAGE